MNKDLYENPEYFKIRDQFGRLACKIFNRKPDNHPVSLEIATICLEEFNYRILGTQALSFTSLHTRWQRGEYMELSADEYKEYFKEYKTWRNIRKIN